MPRLSKEVIDEAQLKKLQELSPPICSVEGFIVRNTEQLCHELDVTERQVNRLKHRVSLSYLPPRIAAASCQEVGPGGPLSVFESAAARYRHFVRQGGVIEIGSSGIDRLLGGGLPLHYVTEIAGLSMSGKTQFCMTSAAIAACGGIGVLYIDTTNGCCARRLHKIISSRLGNVPATEAMSRIQIERYFDLTEVMCLLHALPTKLVQSSSIQNCRLIIIDSVLPLLTPLLGGENKLQGQAMMNTFSSLLSYTAQSLSMAVLITNGMVSEQFSKTRSGEKFGLRPAMGWNWMQVPSIRILLILRDNAKIAFLDKHSHKACGEEVEFEISNAGVID